MARAEIVACGAWMKNTVANLYSHNGSVSARGVARAYLASIVDAVSEIEGKSIAAGMLFDVTDAHLADVLVADLPHVAAMTQAQMVQPMVQAVEPEQLWQWAPFYRALGWAGVGFCLNGPIVWLIHKVFG